MSNSEKELASALASQAATPEIAQALCRLQGPVQICCDGHPLWRHAKEDADAGADEVSIDAPESVWRESLGPAPRPGYQSIGALFRLCSDFKVRASTKAFMQALPTLELLIERSRGFLHPRANEPIQDDLDKLRGRFLRTRHGWLFTEESGAPDGPVLCMLHTAGADSRQWHGLMTHPAMQDWRMVAFDMPNHGRSPVLDDTSQWHWQLSEALYLDVVRGFLESVTDQPVVLMGCSMGAAIGLALLARYPHLCRAAILLETPYHSPGRRTPYLDHPQVHGGRLAATWVASLLSPASPVSRRNLARWVYSQSAPGVYDGDLRFYSDEFRASAHTRHIDTTKTPLWLLTGDYDYSASPDETRKVAAEIPGATFIEMKGFGHFPMTEDPERLLSRHLNPVLRALYDASK